MMVNDLAVEMPPTLTVLWALSDDGLLLRYLVPPISR